MLTSAQIASIDWAKTEGLIPAVVQCASSARVLMLGYVNAQALETTLATGRVTFYSRSKARLWTKGESSGHFLTLVDSFLDCDRDTLLFLANPLGPTCHNGTQSCFDAPTASAASNAEHESTGFNAPDASPVGPALCALSDLDALIARRKIELPSGSYTTSLFQGELRRIAQKVGEEGVETALAAIAQDDAALSGEAADLVFHLLVLLCARGLGLSEVLAVLAQRHRVR
jgi:phosphoribosyl-AMP cyclohydrolase / phosphoribosyl-ATP pyrophosphohydrolase